MYDKAREKFQKSFDVYTTILSKAKYKAKYGKRLKILAS